MKKAPFVSTSTAAVRPPARPKFEPNAILRWRDGSVLITKPQHGDSGWTPDGELRIYAEAFRFVNGNGQFEKIPIAPQWCSLAGYRARKERFTKKKDWRTVHSATPSAAPGRSSPYSPPTLTSVASESTAD